MAEPGKPQDAHPQDTDRSRVSDPTKAHVKDDGQAKTPTTDRHGIPNEMQKAGNDDEEAQSKGLPTSDRENMEAAAANQKPQDP